MREGPQQGTRSWCRGSRGSQGVLLEGSRGDHVGQGRGTHNRGLQRKMGRWHSLVACFTGLQCFHTVL